MKYEFIHIDYEQEQNKYIITKIMDDADRVSQRECKPVYAAYYKGYLICPQGDSNKWTKYLIEEMVKSAEQEIKEITKLKNKLEKLLNSKELR